MAQNKDQKEDLELVAKSLESAAAYEKLVRKYQSKILNYIKRISGVPMEEAEDIAQEVFLKVYQNLNAFDQNKKFSSWLFSIAHNETISYWRKNKKRLNDPDIEDEHLEYFLKDEFNTDEKVDNQKLKEDLEVALKKLPIKYREVVQLKYFYDYSYEEISDIIKKPTATVGTLLSRAKKLLVKEVDLDKYKKYE
ncbi:MAG: RNA polymerase sigma factor [Patescibacteria group bacterium]